MENLHNSTKYRTWALLDELNKVKNPSDFGRINQALLSITFQSAGFIVTHYHPAGGHPDFIADRSNEGYAFEAKATISNKVALSREDIVGVENLGRKPMLAILTYPLLEARWLFIEASKLPPKSYDKNEIERLSITSLENEIAPLFLKVLQIHREKAMVGPYALQSMVESK